MTLEEQLLPQTAFLPVPSSVYDDLLSGDCYVSRHSCHPHHVCLWLRRADGCVVRRARNRHPFQPQDDRRIGLRRHPPRCSFLGWKGNNKSRTRASNPALAISRTFIATRYALAVCVRAPLVVEQMICTGQYIQHIDRTPVRLSALSQRRCYMVGMCWHHM